MSECPGIQKIVSSSSVWFCGTPTPAGRVDDDGNDGVLIVEATEAEVVFLVVILLARDTEEAELSLGLTDLEGVRACGLSQEYRLIMSNVFVDGSTGADFFPDADTDNSGEERAVDAAWYKSNEGKDGRLYFSFDSGKDGSFCGASLVIEDTAIGAIDAVVIPVP
jgi:hypothetical protein